MPNLLPTLQKKKLKQEYHLRVLIVMLSLAMVGFLVSITLMLPAYVLVSSKGGVVEDEIKKVRDNIEAQKGEAVLALLGEVKSTVALLLPAKAATSTTMELFTSLNTARPAGISIHGFSLERKEKENSNLTLVGKAATREDLITFVRQLRLDQRFALVDLPISDLVKAKNLSFTVKISGSF